MTIPLLPYVAKINTKAFQRPLDKGRVTRCGVIIDADVTFTFYTAYGYAGGHGGPSQARLTSHRIHAIYIENKSNGGPPRFSRLAPLPTLKTSCISGTGA